MGRGWGGEGLRGDWKHVSVKERGGRETGAGLHPQKLWALLHTTPQVGSKAPGPCRRPQASGQLWGQWEALLWTEKAQILAQLGLDPEP
jgi:hypothetical protein